MSNFGFVLSVVAICESFEKAKSRSIAECVVLSSRLIRSTLSAYITSVRPPASLVTSCQHETAVSVKMRFSFAMVCSRQRPSTLLLVRTTAFASLSGDVGACTTVTVHLVKCCRLERERILTKRSVVWRSAWQVIITELCSTTPPTS
ncbi:Autophagy protein [Trichinella spiralis]|uniref:Autophagy protein n=1 Tax=Trichinella spiralis TaxID=6334 RepID=A0ABR3KZJ9_TRISP